MQPFSESNKEVLKNHLAQKLSRREAEVAVMVLEGLTNREAADKLCVAEQTVKFHLTNIYRKLNISRRSQIIWTLPLSDFIGGAQRPISIIGQRGGFPSDNTPSAGGGPQAEIIPAGCVTVADQE